MKETLMIGGTCCILLAVIAWEVVQIEAHAERTERSVEAVARRTEKLENASRAFMDVSDCAARCPSGELARCSSECDGAMKEKLRSILGTRAPATN